MTPTPTPPPTPVVKRSRKSQLLELEKKKEKFLDAAAILLTNAKNEDSVFGQSVGLQLGKVDEQQKIIAQKLISDVLYFARLKQLTHGSKILLAQQETHSSTRRGHGQFTHQVSENVGPSTSYGTHYNQNRTYLVNSSVGQVTSVTQPPSKPNPWDEEEDD